MIDIKLHENAYCAGTFYRLPTETGEPSIYAMKGNWYEAHAHDGNDNNYLVFWDVLPDWDGEDESSACDWDNPIAIVQLDPWRDVTAQAQIL